MPLTTCPDCGRRVSMDAIGCPGCGRVGPFQSIPESDQWGRLMVGGVGAAMMALGLVAAGELFVGGLALFVAGLAAVGYAVFRK